MEALTTQQVLALAPDASSAKAGQGLSGPAKWVSLGRSGRSVWGECQGSGKDPYRTQADLTGPAFHCSCPSRKFPCKHGLGLLLLLAANPGRVAEAESPAWVAEWISKRDTSAEKKAAKAQATEEPADPETLAKREADREKRAAKREDRVRAGLADLQTWLSDITRQGFAHARQHPTQFWDGMAARMIDSQAPGIARRLKEWPSAFVSGDQWADRILAEAGELQWLLHGFARIDTLPDDLRATVRSAIGWTVAESELSAAEKVADTWQIVGQRVEEEERLRVQRTWLMGIKTGRPALSLSFAAMNQPLDISLIAGTQFEGELTYHPSAAPLRGQATELRNAVSAIREPAALDSIEAALSLSARLLAGDPWLERTPWFIRESAPVKVGEVWGVRDRDSAFAPFSRSFTNLWPLVAASGGSPVTIFGEWDGQALLPLSAWADGRFISLTASML